MEPSPPGSVLALGRDMPEPVEVPAGGGRAVLISRRHPTRERDNQDSAAVLPVAPDGAVLVVADGMGGHQGPGQASRLAIEEICRAIDGVPADPDALRIGILNGFERADRVVQDLGIGAGTTLAVVCVVCGTVRTFHVGDSMILLTGQRGRRKLQTICHSPVGYAVEAGWIDEEEAMHHDERHVVSNMVGGGDMRIEVGPTVAMAPRDTLLVASDGLFDNLLVDEIVERVRVGDLLTRVGALARECRQRMTSPDGEQAAKPDDLTLIAYRPARR